MKVVELYAQVRYAVQIEGVSRREAARRYGIDPRTVAKMLAFSVPPGYRRSRRPARPKLDTFTGIIDSILVEDEGRPRKQRHTSKRVFERLRDEHGYSGGITSRTTCWLGGCVVARYCAACGTILAMRRLILVRHRRRSPGANARSTFLRWILPHSDACFVRAYLAETAEAFCDGHNAAFEFFGKVPRTILYDNTTLAVARIMGDGCGSERTCLASCSRITCLPTGSAGPGKAIVLLSSQDAG